MAFQVLEAGKIIFTASLPVFGKIIVDGEWKEILDMQILVGGSWKLVDCIKVLADESWKDPGT